MMCLNPSFSASAIRCSTRLTGLTSPLNPTSPHMHQPVSIGVSTLLDNTAAMTLRSIAMSVTFSPPADIEEHVFLHQLEAYALLKDGKQHVQPSLVKACGGALWRAVSC